MSLVYHNRTHKPTTPNETAEKIMEYEKHYHDIVKSYLPEIQAINKLLQNLRDEEKAFWDKFPEIEKAMKNACINRELWDKIGRSLRIF